MTSQTTNLGAYSTGNLTIGLYSGSGQLITDTSSMIVSDGASASAGTTVIGGGGALGNGTLNLGSAAGPAATAAGILDAATVTGSLGGAVFQFNTTVTALAPTYFTLTVNLTDSGGFGAGVYTLVDATGASLSGIGTTSFTLGTTIAGYTYTFSRSDHKFLLTASAIPEPATSAALFALSLAVTRRRPKVTQ